jgi:hypothetical protein
MPIDPPPAFKSGWKAIRLGVAIGSTDVTITSKTIADALTTLGISANSYKISKISVWVMPGAAANQAKPEVLLSIRCPVGLGTLGTREDTGQLSRAAKVSYSFSQSIRDIAIDFPDAGGDGITLGVVAASAASGQIQLSISYNI